MYLAHQGAYESSQTLMAHSRPASICLSLCELDTGGQRRCVRAGEIFTRCHQIIFKMRVTLKEVFFFS